MGFQGFGIGSNMWLGQWSEDPNMVVDGKINTDLRNMYLCVYAVLGLGQGKFINLLKNIFIINIFSKKYN